VFCRRWGVPLIDGGTVRLPRVVGMGRALDLILTGRAVAADEALAIGLANRVVDDGQALAAAQALAAQIAAFPQACLRADRASAFAQWDLPLPMKPCAAKAPAATRWSRAESLAGAARFAAGAGATGHSNERASPPASRSATQRRYSSTTRIPPTPSCAATTRCTPSVRANGC
jgi:enoyl-CoA hydratase